MNLRAHKTWLNVQQGLQVLVSPNNCPYVFPGVLLFKFSVDLLFIILYIFPIFHFCHFLCYCISFIHWLFFILSIFIYYSFVFVFLFFVFLLLLSFTVQIMQFFRYFYCFIFVSNFCFTTVIVVVLVSFGLFCLLLFSTLSKYFCYLLNIFFLIFHSFLFYIYYLLFIFFNYFIFLFFIIQLIYFFFNYLLLFLIIIKLIISIWSCPEFKFLFLCICNV